MRTREDELPCENRARNGRKDWVVKSFRSAPPSVVLSSFWSRPRVYCPGSCSTTKT